MPLRSTCTGRSTYYKSAKNAARSTCTGTRISSASQSPLRSSNEHRSAPLSACKKEPSAATSERRSRTPPPNPPPNRCCANTPRTKYYVARVCARPIIDAFIGLKSVSAKSYHRGATKFPSVLSTGVSRVWRCVQWMKSLAARVLLHVLLPHWRCLLKERVSAEILCSVDVCASRPRSFSLFSDSFMH